MDRRRILLIIAAVVAALGTLLVFLYVRNADARAQESVDAVQVLTVSAPITAGESYDDALAAGKIAASAVARSQLLDNVQTSPDALKGTVALQNLYVGEQVVADKFGNNVAEAISPLGIPEGKMAISVNLTDPDRVAGFVNPGSELSIFVTTTGGGDAVAGDAAGHDDDHRRGRHPANGAAAPYLADARPLPGRSAEGDPRVEDARRDLRPAHQGEQRVARRSDDHQHRRPALTSLVTGR